MKFLSQLYQYNLSKIASAGAFTHLQQINTRTHTSVRVSLCVHCVCAVPHVHSLFMQS